MATYEIGFKPASLPAGTVSATGTMRFPNKIDFNAEGSSIAGAHLVQANQRIKGFYVAGRATTGGVSASVFGGAYVTNSAGTSEGARVFGGTLIAATTSATPQWHFGALDIDLNPFVGQWIKPVARDDGTQFAMLSLSSTVGGYERSTDNFPNPMGAVFTSSAHIPLYIVIEDSIQLITDINSGDPVSGDTSGNTFTTTGFTETITGVSVGGLVCTSVVDTGNAGTFSVPPPVHLSTYPELGVNQDVVITSATQSATLAKSFVLTGYTVTSLVNPEIVDLTYPTAHFDVTPVSTDLMITVTADLTPSADGGITTGAPKTTLILHWVRATEVMYIYDFVINGGGVVSVGGLTASGLIHSGLTLSGLTNRGLLAGAGLALTYSTLLSEFTNMAVYNV